MVTAKAKKETDTGAAFFADIIAAVDYKNIPAGKQAFDTFDTSLPMVSQKIFIGGTLTEKLNAMFPGASAEVSIDDFQITGAEKLNDAQKDFISVNRIPILCTLQQSLLVRHLFSGKPELREIFVEKIQERSGTSEAAAEVTAKWFARLLDV